MTRIWCYHRRQIDSERVAEHIWRLVHDDDRTPCTGRNPRHG
jgi:hypothetical protein